MKTGGNSFPGSNNFQGGSSYIPPPSGNFNQQRQQPQQGSFGNRPSATYGAPSVTSPGQGRPSQQYGAPQQSFGASGNSGRSGSSPSTGFSPPATSYGIPAGTLKNKMNKAHAGEERPIEESFNENTNLLTASSPSSQYGPPQQGGQQPGGYCKD